MKIKYNKIAVIAAHNNEEANVKKDILVKKYGFFDFTEKQENIGDIDLIIALGGDGLMLHLLHQYHDYQIPIYGINFGTIGFLMNSYDEDNLLKHIESAKESIIHPLRMDVIDFDGNEFSKIAINEISLLRQTHQSAKINIKINDKVRLEKLYADGVLVSTAAGSTAYNFSVGGPIIPFNAHILALTPISPFRPRNWKGALLPASTVIHFEIINPMVRTVSATADFHEVRNVKELVVKEDKSMTFRLLFDPNHSLEERIIKEQFTH